MGNKDHTSITDWCKWEDRTRCPLCNYKLVKKHEGLVCIHWDCVLYFKLARGWVYLNNEKKDSELFFTSSYDFDILAHRNLKKWLQLKSEVLYSQSVCRVCGSSRYLQVHHILPRFSHPELAMDIENLMALCEDCHKKIHCKDKHRFN